MILRYLAVCLFSHHSSSVVQMTIKLLYFYCRLCEIGQEACACFYGDKDTKKTTVFFVSFLVSNICTKSRSTGLPWPSTWSCWVFPGFCPDITADTRKMWDQVERLKASTLFAVRVPAMRRCWNSLTLGTLTKFPAAQRWTIRSLRHQQTLCLAVLSGKSPGNKDFRSGTSEHRRHILMDTLLLTCHFLFEQKQLSPQTPCSGGLWVLLAGSDLFTQPRDKSGSPSSPWSNTHQQQHHSPHSHAVPPPPSDPLRAPPPTPRTGRCSWWSLSTASIRGASGAPLCSGSRPRPH